ncbi:MAG: molybdopterin-dependent oxidoreductase [Pseudomonadales bacterium]|nr:molybdopterin-dependent oxidoreductase [Pseudomonadales bacterium]
MPTLIRTNCPRDCYDACGILVEKKEGEPLRILGDPEHPVARGRLCSKCAVAYNGVWQDKQARLQHPLRRSGQKGDGAFERISWGEALAEIASKFQAVIDQHGAEAILHTHYSGTLSLLAHFFPNRFFTAIGASEVDPDTICNAAGHVAWHLLYGESGMGFDPRTAKDAASIFVWGANPSHSAPHIAEHWLEGAKANVVVIDPIQTDSAAAADLHVQPRPGSDAALAFGLLHELHAMDAFDQAYIENFTLGAEEVMSTIASCTPEWTAEQTGVPTSTLRQAAELYAAGPSMLWCGQGLQRQSMGGNVMRSVGLLPALTGNIGKPGTGFCYLNYTPAFAGIDLGELSGARLGTTENKAKAKSISHMDLATRLSDSTEFKAFIAWNTNPLASAPNQTALREAMRREDLFTVVLDCFPTDTTAFADIVLPAASFLEFDDITFGYFNLLLGAQTKVSEPLGESLPNQEIFRRIATAMSLEEPALFDDDISLITHMMNQWDPGFDFDELKTRGHVLLGDEPMPMYADGQFNTRSGKIEIASAKAEQMGLPRTPIPHADQAPVDGRIRLITPSSKWRLNDSHANDSHLQVQAGPATVWLSSIEAARCGVIEGQRVNVRNETGTIELTVGIDDTLPDATALSYKGRWPSIEETGVNVNFLHTPNKTDMGESTSVHGTEVYIEPI